MEIEDELVVMEGVGINVQAAIPLLASNPLLVATMIAVVGTGLCAVKVWHRHRRVG